MFVFCGFGKKKEDSMRCVYRYLCAGLAALVLGAALTGCGRQTEGEPGDTLSCAFFDLTVNSAQAADSYDGYTPAEGNQLIVCSLTLENARGDALPVYDVNFQIQWGNGDEDYAWALDPLETCDGNLPANAQMPREWSLAPDAAATYDLLFEVPADAEDLSLVYLEEYTDSDGSSGEGDLYTIHLNV